MNTISERARRARQRADDLARQEILYRRRDVCSITGLSRSQIYALARRGLFPTPVRLSVQTVAWKKSDLDVWIASRPSAR